MRHFALLLLLATACTLRPLPDAPPGSPGNPPGRDPTAPPQNPGPWAPEPEKPGTLNVPNPTAPTQPAATQAPRPVTLLVGGDVTVGHHYQTYFDEQVGKGRTREEMF